MKPIISEHKSRNLFFVTIFSCSLQFPPSISRQDRLDYSSTVNVNQTNLPLGFWAAHDGDLAFLLSIVLVLDLLILFKRCNLHGGITEPDDVANVGSFGTNDRSHSIVRDVQVRCFLESGKQNETVNIAEIYFD